MKIPWWRRQREEDLDAEVQSHLEMAARERVERGETVVQARKSARREFGNVTLVKEVTRDMWGWTSLERLLQDLRFGVRILLKSPVFTLAAILSLTIGIGATSAIFSVVNGVLLRPLPYHEPERLVRLWHNKPLIGMKNMPVSGGNVNIWRERAESFESVEAFAQTASVITGEGEPAQVQGARIGYNLLPMLGYRPLIGRGFLPEEENKSGNDKVVILSHKLWQKRFGGDETILGSSITLDHTNQYNVIGVMPPEATFPGKSEFWIPETATAEGRHDIRRLTVLAQLKPGVTPEMASTEITQINKQLQQELPGDYEDWDAEVQPLHESIVGVIRSPLLVLFGAVGFVLLIACANVANLLLARAATRRKEMAMRSALGAGRWRLIRQLLTESTMLALMGGAGGVLLAYWAVRGLIALNPPDLPRLPQVSVDGKVLAFTFFTTLIVGVVFGLAPALQSSRPDLNNALKEGSVFAGGRRRWLSHFGLRHFMVLTQTALAVVLLVGAGLLIKSFVKLQQVELGFTPANVIAVRLAPPFNRLQKDQKLMDYYRELLDSLRAVPGVEAAAAASSAPTAGAFMSSPILIAGRPVTDSADAQRSFVTVASADYFRAIGNPLKQGRLFTEDDNESSTPVAIINETLARSYFADEDPIGQRIALRGEPDTWLEIVGVTADVKQFSLEQENKPNFYQPYRQKDGGHLSLILRTAGEPSKLIPVLRSRILEVNKFTAITRVQTLNDLISDSVAQPRFYATLLALFAGIALTLAALGIYSVTAYSVSQRTHEIGIRMALGAQAIRILRLVMGQGLISILAGVAIGLAGAIALTRLLAGLLFGVSRTDPAVFAVIALLLIAIGLVACVIPARRATRVDPLAALRHE